MGRRHRRNAGAKAARTKTARQDHRSTNRRLCLPRLAGVDRRALLTGTALASTLLIAVMTAPTPAHAVTDCLVGNPPPGPITVDAPDAIDCVNTDARQNVGNVIDLFTDTNPGSSIYLNNSGDLTSAAGRGIRTLTERADSRNDVINTGDIDAELGIYARTTGGDSAVYVNNSGAISGANSYRGIWAVAYGDNSTLRVVNSGDIDLNTGAGVYGATNGDGNKVSIVNSGELSGGTYGIFGRSSM